MNEWKIVLLTGAISLITSLLTSRITLAVTQKNEVKKHILEERTKFYFEYFPVVDLLLNHPEKVFDRSYTDKFFSYKARMKLLASKKTFSVYEQLFSIVAESTNAFDIYCGYQNGEDGSYFDQEDFAKLDKKDLQLSCEEFQQKHLPDRKEIDPYIQALYQEMRNDLGSNLK